MAAATQIPSERDLLTRLVAGTAGALGKEFLRRLVTELAAALNAEVAFVAELCEDAPEIARTIASAGQPGIELRESYEFALAGTPCEDAYRTDLLLVPRGARLRYPADRFLRAHALDGYLAIALHDSKSRPIGHIGVVSRSVLDPSPTELQALRVFGARAGAELERRRHEQALAASRARAIQAADEERRRIGRDLHDGAQQRLVVLGQALDLALRELEADPGKAVARLSAAREQAAVASRELRELAQGLHPVGLERGLRGALRSLALQSPLRLTIVQLPQTRLPAVIEATVWFLVSEALSNAIKHADATELRVSATADTRLTVTISDDGSGGACCTRGTGLRGLEARVASLGGELRVDSPSGAGTTLSATLPL
jgi:signal transduction histidine kinase